MVKMSLRKEGLFQNLNLGQKLEINPKEYNCERDNKGFNQEIY